MLYNLEEYLNLLCDLGVTVRSPFNPRLTALMKHVGCKLLLLSRNCWITDQTPKWSHIACVIKRIKTLAVGLRLDSLDVFSVDLISNVITTLDQLLRLKLNPMNPISPRNPPHFSEDQRLNIVHVPTIMRKTKKKSFFTIISVKMALRNKKG